MSTLNHTWIYIMNWQINALILGIGTSLLMSSCKQSTPDELGLELQQEQAGVYFVDDFPVEMTTILVDTIATNNATTMLAGKYTDADFGDISTESYFQVLLPNDNPKLGDEYPDAINFYYTGRVELSAIKTYDYGFGSGKVTIGVHKLAEPIFDSSYYSNESLAFESLILGQKEIGESDGAINFPLDSVFGSELFNKINDTETNNVLFTNQSSFDTYLKGLALVHESGDGVVGFDLFSNKIDLNVYYNKVDSIYPDTVELSNGNIVTDTFRYDTTEVFFSFPVSTSSERFNYIQSDKSSTVFSSLQNGDTLSSSDGGNKAYLQAGLGLKTKLTFPTLSKYLSDNKDHIVINKAEILFNYESNEFDVPTHLILYELDSVNNTERNITIDNSSFGFVQNGEDSYTAQVTAYFQYLLNDPNNVTSLGVYPTSNAMSVNRFVLDQNSGNKPVKIRIYYTSF